MRPIYPAPLLGYRSWYLTWDTLELRSVAIRNARPWHPGVNKAYCDHQLDHSVPNSYCSCGLYAWHDPEKLTSAATMRMALGGDDERTLISGAVVARGDVEAHADGWRAAEAQIIGFCYQAEGKKKRHVRKRLQALQEKYRLPIFETVSELRQYAEDIGSAYPISERIPADSVAYTEAAAELQISAGPEAKAARDLLQVHGIDLETAEHFHIGVLPNQRCLRAPMFFDGEIGDTGGLESSIGAPLFGSDACKVCGTVVKAHELHTAYLKNRQEAKRRSWAAPDEVFTGPRKDYRSCPHCEADSEAAGIGWMLREGRGPMKGYFWEHAASREQSEFYHLQQATRFIHDEGRLYLCNDIFNLWALWSRGHRALIACPRLLVQGASHPAFDEMIEKAAKIARENQGQLTFVNSLPLGSRQRLALDYALEGKALLVDIEDLGMKKSLQSLSRYQLDATDYYPG